MTTAHRPTWKAAVGQANEGGWSSGGAVTKQRSALDAPAHTTLKLRREHQIVIDKKQALERSLLALEQAEGEAAASFKQIGKRPIDPEIEERGRQRLLKQTAEVDLEKIRNKYDDSDFVSKGGGKESDLDEESDLDDPGDDDDDDDSDDDDDEDDEDALQAELAKIRAEREASRLKQEERASAVERAAAAEAAIHGNPLLNQTSVAQGGEGASASGVGGQLKRRWNDDVVFRNQAKGEPTPKKRFINDTVRNDFHKRFLNKFIR